MCIDFRLTKMTIVEIVLAISDKNRASPSGKGSIRKAKIGIYFFFFGFGDGSSSYMTLNKLVKKSF